MDRKSIEDCSVPSLSLASSRARRTIPTKDSQYNYVQNQTQHIGYSNIGYSIIG